MVGPQRVGRAGCAAAGSVSQHEDIVGTEESSLADQDLELARELCLEVRRRCFVGEDIGPRVAQKSVELLGVSELRHGVTRVENVTELEEAVAS